MVNELVTQYAAMIAAPAFVSAALGDGAPAYVRLPGRTLLHDLGADVVAIETDERARGVRIARDLGIRTGRGDQTLWVPPLGRPLARTDRLIVVATRAGLGQLLARTVAGQQRS